MGRAKRVSHAHGVAVREALSTPGSSERSREEAEWRQDQYSGYALMRHAKRYKQLLREPKRTVGALRPLAP
jgi:hypothetical protein